MHETFRRTASGDVRFKYPEPMSWHNKAKHWVDNHNQWRHAPIDLAEIWKMQWWPHCQFSFFLSISEVNEATSRGRARGVIADPVLTFRKKLAIKLMENTLNSEGRTMSPSSRLLRSRESFLVEHSLDVQPAYSGKWTGNSWSKTKQKHQKLYCRATAGCTNRIRTYCVCNKRVPMCQSCHITHVTTL